MWLLVKCVLCLVNIWEPEFLAHFLPEHHSARPVAGSKGQQMES